MFPVPHDIVVGVDIPEDLSIKLELNYAFTGIFE